MSRPSIQVGSSICTSQRRVMSWSAHGFWPWPHLLPPVWGRCGGILTSEPSISSFSSFIPSGTFFFHFSLSFRSFHKTSFDFIQFLSERTEFNILCRFIAVQFGVLNGLFLLDNYYRARVVNGVEDAITFLAFLAFLVRYWGFNFHCAFALNIVLFNYL